MLDGTSYSNSFDWRGVASQVQNLTNSGTDPPMHQNWSSCRFVQHLTLTREKDFRWSSVKIVAQYDFRHKPNTSLVGHHSRRLNPLMWEDVWSCNSVHHRTDMQILNMLKRDAFWMHSDAFLVNFLVHFPWRDSFWWVLICLVDPHIRMQFPPHGGLQPSNFSALHLSKPAVLISEYLLLECTFKLNIDKTTKYFSLYYDVGWS